MQNQFDCDRLQEKEYYNIRGQYIWKRTRNNKAGKKKRSKTKNQIKIKRKGCGRFSGRHFYLSAFTFGGGYVIVSLMKKKFVDEYHWIEEEEMLDLVAIAQSAPGAIAVNGAIVIGYKLAGIVGSSDSNCRDSNPTISYYINTFCRLSGISK